MNSSSDMELRATHRRRESPCGIGAAFEADVTEADRDGRRFSLVVTDTMNGFGQVEVHAPRVQHDTEVKTLKLEELVEMEAGSFPVESRMSDLIEASPLTIELFVVEK